VGGFIKICGLTDERAVSAALEAGADAIGFVFAPSVRQVEPARARELARAARGRVPCVAVTLHPSRAQLAEILDEFGPDVLQTDAGDLADLALPAGLATLPVWRDAAAARRGSGSGRILFEGPRSGTGTLADWSAARELALERELVLAGGLAPENVEEAIARVRPFGVDVSSGVEERPGRKDPARIADFVARARAAFARLTREREL
jgi:phosphoribosylanthranilate isomerase